MTKKQDNKGGRPKVDEGIQKQKKLRRKAFCAAFFLNEEKTPEIIRKAGNEFIKTRKMKPLDDLLKQIYTSLRSQLGKDASKINIALVVHDQDYAEKKEKNKNGDWDIDFVYDENGRPQHKDPHMHFVFWTETKGYSISLGSLGNALQFKDPDNWNLLDKITNGIHGITRMIWYLTHEAADSLEDETKVKYDLSFVCSNVNLVEWRKEHPFEGKIKKKKTKLLEPREIFDMLINKQITWDDLGDSSRKQLFDSWSRSKIRTAVMNMFEAHNKHELNKEGKHLHRDNYFIFGDAGTGKTTFAKYLLDELCDGDYYELVHGNSGSFAGAFDGYTNQKGLLLDELRPATFGPESFLKLFDQNNSGRTVQARYSNRVLVNDVTVATTVTDVRHYWEFVAKKEQTAGADYQFFRRLGLILYFQRIGGQTRVSLYKADHVPEALLDSIKYIRECGGRGRVRDDDYMKNQVNSFDDLKRIFHCSGESMYLRLVRGLFDEMNVSDCIGLQAGNTLGKYKVLCSFSMKNEYQAPWVLTPNSRFFYDKNWKSLLQNGESRARDFDLEFRDFEHNVIHNVFPHADIVRNVLPYLVSSTGLCLLGTVTIGDVGLALDNKTAEDQKQALDNLFRPILQKILDLEKNESSVAIPELDFGIYKTYNERVTEAEEAYQRKLENYQEPPMNFVD